ncbi:MAG: DNA repair protein RadC [Syntrophomonadaceae bacterium]
MQYFKGDTILSEYRVTIKELPENMRPREKMLAVGELALSEAELLAIIIGRGTSSLNAIELATVLLASFGGMRGLKEASLEELTSHHGIGLAKGAGIKAALELGRRGARDIWNKAPIKSPEDVKNIVLEEMRYYDREHFRVLYLDRKGGLICMEDVSVGGLHSSLVHPREVYKTAIKRSAASIILVHNHPSGDPEPSKEDIEVSRMLIEAGHLMGIEVLDHLIIGENNYTSLKSRGLI